MKIGFQIPHFFELNNYLGSGLEMIEAAKAAEAVGFDSVWLLDCLRPSFFDDTGYSPGDVPDEWKDYKSGAWECLSLASAIAVTTERVEIGTMVLCTAYRNPAIIARTVETIDELSAGRLVLGVGAGAMHSDFVTFGYPWDRRVSRFEETLRIISPLLKGQTVTYSGEFHQVQGAELVPKGPRPDGPPILIAPSAFGPRMIRLVCEFADQWGYPLQYGDSHIDGYVDAARSMAQGCEKHERDPSTLKSNVTVAVDFKGDYPATRVGANPLSGSPAQIADELAKFGELGVDDVVLWTHPPTLDVLDKAALVVEELRS